MPVLHAREGIRCTTATDQGAVLLNTCDGIFYGLNPAASAIWSAVADGVPADHALDQAADALTRSFAIDPATAREHAGPHLALLIERGLLEQTP
jgi:hypothetical protein